MTDRSKIEHYYNQFSVWDRLETAAGSLELELSLKHLECYLTPDMKLLDLGGGPGRYTIELAENGYQVFLADLSPEQIAIAQGKIANSDSKNNVLGAEVVSALDLSLFDDNSFDSVICFGPFYHLTCLEERVRAANEIHRVLKKGGILFCSYIPRWSGIKSLIWRAANIPEQISVNSFNNAFENGIFENRSQDGFQEGYFYKTIEIKSFFESFGLTTLDVVAVQGIGADRENDLLNIKENNPDLYESIITVILESSKDEAVLEFGGHCIYTGRK